MTTNGNGKLGMIATLGDRLMRVLPPAFLLLLILNILFMGSVIYVIQHNSEQRNTLLTKIVDQCLLQQKPK